MLNINLGEQSDFFYVIEEGECDVMHTDSVTGKQNRVTVLSPYSRATIGMNSSNLGLIS